MDSLRLIDYLLSIIAALLGVGWIILFYSLRQNAGGVKDTAALVLSEKEKLAALLLSEKDKLAAIVKTEHDKLETRFVDFRIKVAEDYATIMLVEKVLKPILDQLGKIEVLLESKLDRREFIEHRVSVGNITRGEKQ